MRALVVIPTYNEVANIATALRTLREASPGLDALVVDDGSPDGTADVVDAIAARERGIATLRRRSKDGLGRAYLAGFEWAMERGYEAVVEMDADLSHDPAAAHLLVEALADADLVIGSRYVPGGSIPDWSLGRRLLSRWGNRYAAAMLGSPLQDLTSGFRAFRTTLLGELPLDRVRADGYGFQIEMAWLATLAGARVREVPIRFVDRTSGTSKMSARITFEALALVTGWGVRRVLAPRSRGQEQPTTVA